MALDHFGPIILGRRAEGRVMRLRLGQDRQGPPCDDWECKSSRLVTIGKKPVDRQGDLAVWIPQVNPPTPVRLLPWGQPPPVPLSAAAAESCRKVARGHKARLRRERLQVWPMAMSCTR